MSDPQDPYANPPGWTDPYEDLTGLSGDEPIPPMEPPTTPPAQPPGSPLLTGLIIGLLLVALSVAVFQLLGNDDDGSAEAGDTTTTTLEEGATTTTADGAPTTTEPGATTTTVPPADAYPPVDPAIPVDDLKFKTDGIRVNDNNIPDIDFGTPADTAIGRLVASFGESTKDTGWQSSTNQYGVCEGDLERVIFFGPLAAIVTKPSGEEVFNGYRQDLTFSDDLSHEASLLETLSGLKIGDTILDLREIYSSQTVEFATHPSLGDVYEVRSASSGTLLLWGPVNGTTDTDRIVGIYAPDICDQ